MGRICGVSLVATIGTLPCTALWFGKISIAGILSNIVVVPAAAVSLVLGIIALVASQIHAGVAAAYASVNQLILQWTLCFTIAVGGSPSSAVEITGLPPLFVPAYYAALLLLFSGGWDRLRRRLVIGVLGLVVVAILVDTGEVFIRAELPVRVTFLDVGQGDAILVEMPEGRTMLIDAGSRTPTSDSGKRTIAPYLRRRGIQRIDWLVLTHAHTDHIGGAASLLRQFPVHVLVAGPRSLSQICVPPDCEVIVQLPVACSCRPPLFGSTCSRTSRGMAMMAAGVRASTMNRLYCSFAVGL